MKKEKTLFDYVIISVIVLAFICLFVLYSLNSNPKLAFYSLLTLVISFMFLSPLSEALKNFKRGTLNLWDKISLIIRAVVSAIIGVFLYNFILNDYNYWLANKNYITKLAIFSLASLLLAYFVFLIITLKEKKEKTDSKLRLIVTLFFTLLNLYFFTLPLLNYYSPKKEFILPVIKKPKSITIYLESTRDKTDIFSTQKTAQITDEKTIDIICNAFSNSTVENSRNLDGIKIDLCKIDKNYYCIEPNYNEPKNPMYPFTLDDLKNGYLMKMKMLQDGVITISVWNQDIYKKETFNPFRPSKSQETYKIQLAEETVKCIKEAIKKQ